MGRVLVVDDQAAVRMGLEKLLRRHGWDTASTGDGVRCLDLMCTWEPDAVLLDLSISGMSGLDVLSQAARKPALAPIPILVMSSQPEAPTRVTAFDLGAVDVVAKPPVAPELVARLRVWVGRDRQQRARRRAEPRLGANGSVNRVEPLKPMSAGRETHLRLADRELLRWVRWLPPAARERIAAHLAAERPVIVSYGWRSRARTAEAGCLIGIAYSVAELDSVPADRLEALHELAEDVFPTWAAQWVGDADTPLPEDARRRLLTMLRRSGAASD